ncbi:hypothetical protein ENSA5_22560 [Enhygromyxa salina]|uniref:Uncharacterized protein n=2 Tax=Enhygromyxa salina TaxID=215803 RepID=A0A2S9YBI7_9BACT|nr:hypothetical protein ENSA5_22560 [Enhygromyxa salina]
MSANRDWRTWFGLVLVLASILVAGVAFVTRDAHVLVEFRGREEQAVIERLGAPSRDVELQLSDAGPEYRAPAIIHLRERPSEPVRELTWEGWFRTTHVWFEQRGNEWAAFEAYEHSRWEQY